MLNYQERFKICTWGILLGRNESGSKILDTSISAIQHSVQRIWTPSRFAWDLLLLRPCRRRVCARHSQCWLLKTLFHTMSYTTQLFWSMLCSRGIRCEVLYRSYEIKTTWIKKMDLHEVDFSTSLDAYSSICLMATLLATAMEISWDDIVFNFRRLSRSAIQSRKLLDLHV